MPSIGPYRSTLLSATKSLVLAVPMAWIGAELAGLTGIFIGMALVTALSGLLAALWIRGLASLTHKTPGLRKAERYAEKRTDRPRPRPHLPGDHSWICLHPADDSPPDQVRELVELILGIHRMCASRPLA